MSLKKTIFSLLLSLASASTFAAVINFDDLSGDETAAIASGYHGFNWDNVGSIRADAYPGSGYEAGTVSQSNTAFNRDGNTVTISKADAGSFDFIGAFFTSAWLDQEISFEGSRNGQLLYSTATSYVIDTATPLWLELAWSGIDTLSIYNSNGTPWAMDDFTFTEPAVAAVPEPASVALFGASLAGLMLARRRKKVPM